jgi:sec-independent protein translocase protein TatA
VPEPGVVGTFPGMPFGLGIWEILILAGVLVLLFGAKGAPAMARRLGTGVREMKDAVSEMDPRTVFDDKDEPPKSKPLPALEAAKTEAPQPEAVPSAEAVAAPASVSASETIVAAEGEAPTS